MLREKKHVAKEFTQYDKNSKHNRVMLFLDVFREYENMKRNTLTSGYAQEGGEFDGEKILNCL